MSNIDPTVELSIWEDMQRKYMKQRDDLSTEEEKQYIKDCFSLYEKEGFARFFWSQDDDYKEYINKSFEVINRCSEQDVDLCCLPMWNIKFENGAEIAAYPEEIIPSEMIKNGCEIENLQR